MLRVSNKGRQSDGEWGRKKRNGGRRQCHSASGEKHREEAWGQLESVTSQAVGLEHIRESTDTRAKPSLCPWHCCPECQDVPSAPFLLVLHIGRVPDEKPPSPAEIPSLAKPSIAIN